MLYIGIDPGESWCGFAALDVSDTMIRAEARTYSVTSRGGYLKMTHALLDLLPHNRQTTIIVEDFRIRKAGHQSYSRGDTLRFIGALEYGASCIDAFGFHLISPNDHGEQETRQLFGHVLYNYRRNWPRPRHAAWGHCLSAWRVLGQHLMQRERAPLLALHTKKKSHHFPRWLPTSSTNADHIAPAAWWLRK